MISKFKLIEMSNCVRLYETNWAVELCACAREKALLCENL